MDQYYHQKNWPVYIKANYIWDKQLNKTQIPAFKACQTLVSKASKSLKNFLHFKNITKAPNKKNKKDKKYCHCQNQARKEANSNTFATNVNATSTTWSKKDFFEVDCNNCNKKRYYS